MALLLDRRRRAAGEHLDTVLVGDGAVDVDQAIAALLALAGHRGGAGECVARPHLLREADLEAAKGFGAEPVLELSRAMKLAVSMPWPKTDGLPTEVATVSSWCIGLKSPEAPA